MTSARTSRSAAASGVASLSAFSPSKVKLPRRRGWRRRNYSFALKSLNPVKLTLPSSAEVRDELDDVGNGLWARKVRRETPGRYNSANRCWGCNKFVSGPFATCGSCGYQHGGVFHDAYATR